MADEKNKKKKSFWIFGSTSPSEDSILEERR
uniref:Uncharacterized protein n=1 Tax=Nelumbo nucifera TaxID=4432 RepID=A0A822YMM5_NELNU|nr:TPA_asm: hypothetical protein HUJ06_011007 [Nelumbo nucifera]